MGNACSCIRGRGEPKKKITLAILGIDGAGKTTISKALIGDELDLEVAPTVGFNTDSFTFNKYELTLYDIGGGKNVRRIWTHYFHEIYGVIYVVDSTATKRISEIQENLKNLLEHPQVTGKPLLLLANKSDLKDAMESIDVCEKIHLEEQVNKHKCPSRIESTSAVKGTGKKVDPKLKEGLKWLCGMIEHNWDQYTERVNRDMEVQRVRDEEEKAIRRERVRKIKEEREKAEKAERKRLGIEEPNDDDEDEDTGDPFKPIGAKKPETKKRNEERVQAQKSLNLAGPLWELETESGGRRRSRKKESSEKEDDSDDVDSDDLAVNRSYRSPRRFNLSNGDAGESNYDKYDEKRNRLKQTHLASHMDENEDSDVDIYTRGHKLTPRLPPLQRPLGAKFMDETIGTSKKKKSKKQKLRAVEEIDDETEDHYKKSVGSLSKISFSARGNNLRQVEDDEEESEDSSLRAKRAYGSRQIVAGYDNLSFSQREKHEDSLYRNNRNSRSNKPDDSLYNNGADSRFGNRNNLYSNNTQLGNYRGLGSRFEDQNDYNDASLRSRFGVQDSRYSNRNGDLGTEDSDAPVSQKKKGKKKKGKNKNSQDFSRTVVDPDENNESDERERSIAKLGSYRLSSLDGEDADKDTPVRRLKKKQPYTVKKNKTFPSDNSDEDVPDTKKRDFSWTMSPKRTKPEEGHSSPVHISRTNWGLAEDLSDELSEGPSDDDRAYSNFRMRRSKPNMDDDDDIVY
ncbi:transcriptional regulator ATRX homolog [Pecten maximus]|uniref:transcriptional regulator ATRX homolog n=1 Tax=Pecten maximus TaxID=6579 RepID=UPI001458E4AF|nr:transcriptional regulator ATRX homolog [Pecten maximus]